MAYTTINKSTAHFNTKLYTGTGSQLAVTGVGFQPDWIWFKNRGTTNSHGLQDSVRGFNTTGIQSTNGTDADPAFNGNTLGYVSAVGSDGFTVEAGNCANASSNNYVAWNWKANGAGSSNYDGDITSTVSVNTTAGFSIVSYTGNGSSNQTVGHGLGVKPAVMILKNRDDTNNWVMYHHKLNNGTNPEVKYLELNTNNAQLDDASIFNDTAPTSSVFTIGSASDTGGGSGGNNEKIIAYCFAEKTGYSKFGSYTGNGNADGTFVYTGFKPAFVLVKRYDGTGLSWRFFDSKRNYNGDREFMYANLTDEEVGGDNMDFLSNGFKSRNTSGHQNGNGDDYIYMAFGQSLVGSNNVPCTAR